ncbi:MAG: hypothetical protein VX834_08315 [Myxococcota bacterium]|nr:hypothetical protein [Myxococcota bacterium]
MVSKYRIGQHGAKRREQRRLREAHGERVSGRTHESEHAIGFAPLNETSKMKRGANRKVRTFEKKAWAYQEQKPFHRAHIGTGMRMQPDGSGFNAVTYRDAQRDLLEAKHVSSAVQLNQLGYAFLPNFRAEPDSPKRRSANDSFAMMVESMDKVDYATGQESKSVDVDPQDRVEMALSRIVAMGEGEGPGGWPSEAQIEEAKARYGADEA